jgi:hypothetical protein
MKGFYASCGQDTQNLLPFINADLRDNVQSGARPGETGAKQELDARS